MRKHVYSKKGVGTALGAVFFIGIVLLSLTALITISGYQMKYFQTRDKMIEWDIKRMSESIAIVNLTQPSKKPGYTFDLIVNNTGGVLVKIVRIYIYDNKYNNLSIFDKQKASGEDGFINGEVMPGEGNHAINVKAQNPLADDSPYRYRIIACTERGRQFSFSYPKPKPLLGGAGGVGPAHIGYLVMTFNQMSLLYTDFTHPIITSAWENLEHDADNVVWHLNITNIGTRDITLLKESRLIVSYITSGEIKVSNVWYISKPPQSVPPGWNKGDNPSGVPGYTEDQTIEPNHWEWVAFGADSPGDSSVYGKKGNKIPGLKEVSANDVVWIILEFHYKYGDEYYSQVIPFAAITLK